ncbi:MAG: Mov34/MPN/PAD-1 family protein [Candidatus Caldarchaeum sp.]|nr:Mov34/MPN/PAD-1 family protein [Candidatus Caldarchaeum sp.]MDW8063469.1 Mov34/MPN/PAD-1 family protein [Candidatus Caldarchaeum sp.]
MRVRIYPLALGKVVKHATAVLNREVAGLLIGKSAGKVLEIWDAMTGEQYGTPAYVQLDEMVMAKVAEDLAKNDKGLYIVGWYHSHPGLDVFLSPTDIDTQKRYQMMYSKAVALVIDPVEFAKTHKISSLKFKVFQISKEGRVVSLPVSIGIHRAKLLESTLHALSTFDVRHLTGEAESKTVSSSKSEVSEGLLGKAKKLFGA